MISLEGNRVSTGTAYQLPRGAVDPEMVHRAERRLLAVRSTAVAAALRSPVWGGEYLSLIPYRKLYRELSAEQGRPVYVFEPGTGAVYVPVEYLATSPLGGFFTPYFRRRPEELDKPEKGFAYLRGSTYYVALDFSKKTPEEKLAVMETDVAEGLSSIASVDRRSLNARDFLLYLGILDHIKAHTITAFHALTFYEREGFMPDDVDYLPVRRKAQELMVTTIRAYYQACLGQSFDGEFSAGPIKNTFEEVAEYIASSGHSIEHFTYAESGRPVIIMLSAHEAARRKPFPDVIIGIPSGGTEVAVVTQFMYKGLYPKRCAPDLGLVPLSFHYLKQKGIQADRLADLLRRTICVTGKGVLVVDDNSNTGSTLQRMSEALSLAGASEVDAHIAEIDPARVILNSTKKQVGDFGTAMVVNMDHPAFKTAMGVCSASSADGRDFIRIKAKRYVEWVHQHIEKRMAYG